VPNAKKHWTRGAGRGQNHRTGSSEPVNTDRINPTPALDAIAIAPVVRVFCAEGTAP